MIHKPGKPEHQVSSYRPISLLPILSKMLVRILLSRMLPILHMKGIIPDQQFGFRQKHRTPEQIYRIIKEAINALENKQYCSAVFLDFEHAFDRVGYGGLLLKLKRFLLHLYFALLKSYLNERTFLVRVGGSHSTIGAIRAGVPWGSVLGLILNTICSEDMRGKLLHLYRIN